MSPVIRAREAAQRPLLVTATNWLSHKRICNLVAQYASDFDGDAVNFGGDCPRNHLWRIDYHTGMCSHRVYTAGSGLRVLHCTSVVIGNEIAPEAPKSKVYIHIHMAEKVHAQRVTGLIGHEKGEVFQRGPT